MSALLFHPRWHSTNTHTPNSFSYFAGNGAELQRVLKALATCGLYAVCTLPISPETQDEDASNLRKYRTFWRSVFEMHTEAGDLQIPSLLFDEVVKATLQLVGRLEIGFEAARSPDAAAVPDPEDKVSATAGCARGTQRWKS